MCSTDKKWLRAIFVSETEEQSKAIGSALNNAGYKIKGVAVNSLNGLIKNLEKPDWDIIVADANYSHLPLTHISENLAKLSPQPPLLAIRRDIREDIREDITTQARLAALSAGACDIAPANCPQLIALILKRELKRNTPNTETSSSDNTLTHEESIWRDKLEIAVKEDRFVTVFQPIVNLCAEPGENYEALLRMLDENDQEILPGAFIGVAEKVGLMSQIDHWVIKHTIETINERNQAGVKTCFFVKLSESSLVDKSFISWLADQLQKNKIPERSLVLEISEALSVKHPQLTKALFQSLHQLNCLSALDHVGTEDSQDTRWTTFDLSFIKLSGRLIRDLASNQDSQKSVTFIAAQAKARKIKTVAQFIQDTTSLSFLYQHGINYIQGYYLQRPEATLNYNFLENEGE